MYFTHSAVSAPLWHLGSKETDVSSPLFRKDSLLWGAER